MSSSVFCFALDDNPCRQSKGHDTLQLVSPTVFRAPGRASGAKAGANCRSPYSLWIRESGLRRESASHDARPRSSTRWGDGASHSCSGTLEVYRYCGSSAVGDLPAGRISPARIASRSSRRNPRERALRVARSFAPVHPRDRSLRVIGCYANYEAGTVRGSFFDVQH